MTAMACTSTWARSTATSSRPLVWSRPATSTRTRVAALPALPPSVIRIKWTAAEGKGKRKMNANHNKSWILILVFVCVMLCTPMSGHAFVLSFGGSLHDPAAVRSSAADVLYATDRDRGEVKLVGTDSSLLEGTPLDLGMQSVAPDGTVFFGAAFRRNDRVRWEMFAANPDEHSL